MFKIYDGRKEFYQWDLNQKLIVDDAEINEVHFCNRTDDCSLVCEVYDLEGLRVADVPNILLQTDWKINVYAYDANYTKHSALFDVVKRTKPANYIYTETEIKNYDDLVERVNQIEENGISDEAINDAVSGYLAENPIEVDLTDYYTKEETEALIPTTDGLATISYVDEKISSVKVDVDLTDYYTKEEVNNLIPEAPDLSGYALKTDIPDHSKYALKSDIPDVSSYQTAEQVAAAITSALGEIGVAEEGEY